jgi:hypothetical protein
MNHIEKIVEWQKERLLDKQELDLRVEYLNILEELMEGIELDEQEPRDVAEQLLQQLELFGDYKTNAENLVDLFGDIIVFSVGAILKLKHDPSKVMDEIIKEISSRRGEIINGKFVKDKSDEARKKWYKADFKKCRI